MGSNKLLYLDYYSCAKGDTIDEIAINQAWDALLLFSEQPNFINYKKALNVIEIK